MELNDWSPPYRDKLAPCHSACGLARSGQGRVKVLTLAKQHLDPIPPRRFTDTQDQNNTRSSPTKGTTIPQTCPRAAVTKQAHRCLVLHQLIDRHSLAQRAYESPSATHLTTWARPKCLFASTCQTHGTQPSATIYMYEEEHKPIQP